MPSRLSGRGWSRALEIEAAVAATRVLWRLAISVPGPLIGEGTLPPGATAVALRPFAEDGALVRPEMRKAVAEWVDWWVANKPTGTAVQRPLEFIVEAVGAMNPADVKYLVMRELRRAAGLTFSANTVRLIRTLCDVVNNALGPDGQARCAEGFSPLLARLGATAREIGGHRDLAARFIELCWMLDYVTPTAEPDVLQFHRTVSHDRLLSHLFGLPTQIPGFDALFSDGGVFVADVPQDGSKPSQESRGDDVGARTILVSGPFGSGKSLLGLEFAVEVARKGGVAWILAFEQTVEECLYSLETIGIPTRDNRFDVVSGLPAALKCFNDEKQTGGVIALFSPGELGYVEFLDSLETHLAELGRFPLRLVVIDPLNSLIVNEKASRKQLRARAVRFLQAAKRSRVNIWMACERAGDEDFLEGFEEKIADTVLHLGFESHGQYRRRFIEVTKSRLQREQSGRHSLFIRGTGLQIFPSSIAVSTPNIDERRTTKASGYISLGLPGLDEILGDSRIKRGDVVMYAGPAGTGKTIAGIRFLVPEVEVNFEEKTSSLLVADRDPRKMEVLVAAAASGKTSAARIVEYCPIHPGFTDPGQVLDRIRRKLRECQDAGRSADRVMVTNLTRWAASMPLVRDDPTFGVALLALVRRHNATLLVLLSDSEDHEENSLRSFIAEHSDCVIEFQQISVRGIGRSLLRAVKTTRMAHRREAFEITYNGDRVTVEPTTSLVRLHPDGDTSPVPITLYLHSETTNHRLYNQRLLGIVRAVLSPRARIRPQYETFDPHMLAMSASSAVDEVQVLQLDEFQTSGAAGRTPNLIGFPAEQVTDSTSPLVDRMRLHCGAECNTIHLVPFYDNISLLAYRRSAFRRTSFPGSWQELAQECREWEHDNEGLFFACHACGITTIESYNCLFIEILRSIEDLDAASGSHCDLLRWIDSEAGRQAALLFWTLCRRSHRATTANSAWTPDSSVYASARVWRHWYNTLNQMLYDMTPDDAQDIEVVPLYDNVTTAGEWYLGVTAHSAAPDAALQLIRYLTTREQELRRLHLGVGLPTRAEFYDKPGPDGTVRLSPFFSMDARLARTLIQRAFRRSRFPCYATFSELLSSHLVRILRLPPDGIEDAVQAMLASMRADFEFMRYTVACEPCSEGRELS